MLLKDFKEFLLKQNALALAVGAIIGAALSLRKKVGVTATPAPRIS